MNNSSQPQRKSIRLKEYDYSFPGWYYVTLCTYNRINLFGKVLNGIIMLNDSGKIVEEEWLKTKQIRSNVDLDYYVIMPNHFHGIIINEQSNEYVGATRLTAATGRGELNSPAREDTGRMQYAPTNNKFKSPSQTIGAIVRGFKSSVTKRVREIPGNQSLKIWQRNYYEHIIGMNSIYITSGNTLKTILLNGNWMKIIMLIRYIFIVNFSKLFSSLFSANF